MSRLERNALEWVVFAIGLVVVLGTVGLIVYDMVKNEDSPPHLAVELGSPRPHPGGWAVPVTVRNQGGETAEGARVEVLLERPGGRSERAEFDAAFVPSRSRREGWVVFRHPPASGRLSARVIGYEKP